MINDLLPALRAGRGGARSRSTSYYTSVRRIDFMLGGQSFVCDVPPGRGAHTVADESTLFFCCLCQCESLCRNNDIPVNLSASAIIVVLCALTSLLIASSELALTNIPPHHSSTICIDAVHFFRHVDFSLCGAMRTCPPLSPLDFPLSARIAASSATM